MLLMNENNLHSIESPRIYGFLQVLPTLRALGHPVVTMNRNTRHWLFLALLPAICVANDADKSTELKHIRARIREIAEDVRDLASEKSTQVNQLKSLEKQYGELINSLDSIKSEINQQERMLQDIKNKIIRTQASIASQQTELLALVKAAYSMGEQNGLKVLLNQRDAALSGRMLTYFNYIGKARGQKLETIKNSVTDMQQLERQKTTETQLLQIALQKKQQETEALQRVKHQREQVIAELGQAYSTKQGQLSSLIHDEKKLESLVASLQKSDDNAQQLQPPPVVTAPQTPKREPPAQPAPSKPPEPIATPIVSGKPFAEFQGQLPWPVQGDIVERFGDRRFETSWDGTVIGAREGADIRAVASGRVVFADWLRGYGLMTIVDHGKGYMTLYGFNQSLHKRVGDVVKTGDRLASVGRSGGRAQAALYFGIRKQGRAVDPEHWCRKPDRN